MNSKTVNEPPEVNLRDLVAGEVLDVLDVVLSSLPT